MEEMQGCQGFKRGLRQTVRPRTIAFSKKAWAATDRGRAGASSLEIEAHVVRKVTPHTQHFDSRYTTRVS